MLHRRLPLPRANSKPNLQPPTLDPCRQLCQPFFGVAGQQRLTLGAVYGRSRGWTPVVRRQANRNINIWCRTASDSISAVLCPTAHGGSSRVEDSGQCASGRWTQPSEVRDDACSHDGQRQPSPIDDSTNTKHPAQRGQDGTKSRPPESRERSPCRRAYTAQDQVWFRLQEQCL